MKSSHLALRVVVMTCLSCGCTSTSSICSSPKPRPVAIHGADKLPLMASGEVQVASLLQRIEITSDAGVAVQSHLLRMLDAYTQAGHPSTSGFPQLAGQDTAVLRKRRATILEQLLPRGDRQITQTPKVEFTEQGCRFRVAANRFDAGEQHPGQVLCALAEVGVPLTQTAIVSNRRFCVADLVRECAESFQIDQEIEWRSIALALYRPEVHEWKNRYGEVVSFDAITRELLRRTRSRGSVEHACWGTHALYALSVFRSVDKVVHLWQDRTLRLQVESAFVEVAERLSQSQLADGSWDQHWELPMLTRAGTAMDDWQRLLITGHHLEWLALVPRELRPPDRVLLMAGGFVLRSVIDLSSDEIQMQICPCSHGLRAFGIAGIQIMTGP